MNNRPKRAEVFKSIARRRESVSPICGKRVYKFKGDAKNHMKRISSLEKSHREGYVIGVYRCDQCEGWHVGHTRIWSKP
jgi:hypothetical protein